MRNVIEFLKNKNVEDVIYNNLGYICQSGSHIFGTNNEDSDLDYRGIVLPNEDYIIGLKEFNHLKLVEGEGNLNLSDDLDVELFSLKKFIMDLYKGHGIAFEMLFVNDNFIKFTDDRLKPIFNKKELFLSKSFAFHYLSMNNQFERRIDIKVGNIKNPLSIDRIEKYGYETKNASKAIQHLRLLNDFLNTGELNFYREDREELKSIKRGEFSLEDIKYEINTRRPEIESLIENSNMERKPDFIKINELYKELVKQFI